MKPRRRGPGPTAWLVVGAMLATALWSACESAATVAHHMRRPRRSADYRGRYYDRPQDTGGNDRTEADDANDDDDDRGRDHVDEDGDDDGDDDQRDFEGYSPYAADEVRKRGAIARPLAQQYERKPLRPPYATLAANSLRVDPSLLRDEVVELPTYVNVPVTLRCKFVPLENADNKFETVVEAMYPGHRNAPPPPADSHAARVLGQLMGSVDGWRGAVGHPTRQVRRVSVDGFYGRRAWPVPDQHPTAQSPYGGNGAGGRWFSVNDGGRRITARLRAAERAQWFRQNRRWFPQGQPGPIELPRFERLPGEERWTRNKSTDDRQDEPADGQQVDEQQTYERQDQRIEDRQDGHDELVEDRQDEQVEDRQDKQVEDRQDEQLDNGQGVQVDDGQYEQSGELDGGQHDGIINGQQYEQARQAEMINGQVYEQARQAKIINGEQYEQVRQDENQQFEQVGSLRQTIPVYDSQQNESLDVRQVDSVRQVEERTTNNEDGRRMQESIKDRTVDQDKQDVQESMRGPIKDRAVDRVDERHVQGPVVDRTADDADGRRMQEPVVDQTSNTDKQWVPIVIEDVHPMGPRFTTVAGSDYASFTDKPVQVYVENMITMGPV